VTDAEREAIRRAALELAAAAPPPSDAQRRRGGEPCCTRVVEGHGRHE
jgi:hypothetical protein